MNCNDDVHLIKLNSAAELRGGVGVNGELMRGMVLWERTFVVFVVYAVWDWWWDVMLCGVGLVVEWWLLLVVNTIEFSRSIGYELL